MNFRPNPLLYGANEEFCSTFKLAITMRDTVEHEVLSRSVAKAIERYPYFCVYPLKKGNSIVLQFNNRPVPVFDDGRCVVLGTEESNGHLLCFGCDGRKLFLNASHYIADGMGIVPLLKTVLYLYVEEIYGTDGLKAEGIEMPKDPVMEEEYSYPFPEKPFEIDSLWIPKKAPDDVYTLNPDEFDKNGLYAYHLHIPQKNMMKIANPADGSPVSFLSVMLFRAICSVDESLDKPVVVHVQHQYRGAINAPMNRHSLVSYIPVMIPAKAKDWHVERQNTILRGQVIFSSEKAAELCAVNKLVEAFPDGENVSLAEKEQAMRRYAENSINGKTLGISYVGKMDWCGLDQYVVDIHAYIGEKKSENMLLVEVMTVGEDFTINFMQSGCGRRYVDAFAKQLQSFDIPVSFVGEERFTLCDTKLAY